MVDSSHNPSADGNLHPGQSSGQSGSRSASPSRLHEIVSSVKKKTKAALHIGGSDTSAASQTKSAEPPDAASIVKKGAKPHIHSYNLESEHQSGQVRGCVPPRIWGDDDGAAPDGTDYGGDCGGSYGGGPSDGGGGGGCWGGGGGDSGGGGGD